MATGYCGLLDDSDAPPDGADAAPVVLTPASGREHVNSLLEELVCSSSLLLLQALRRPRVSMTHPVVRSRRRASRAVGSSCSEKVQPRPTCLSFFSSTGLALRGHCTERAHQCAGKDFDESIAQVSRFLEALSEIGWESFDPPSGALLPDSGSGGSGFLWVNTHAQGILIECYRYRAAADVHQRRGMLQRSRAPSACAPSQPVCVCTHPGLPAKPGPTRRLLPPLLRRLPLRRVRLRVRAPCGRCRLQSSG